MQSIVHPPHSFGYEIAAAASRGLLDATKEAWREAETEQQRKQVVTALLCIGGGIAAGYGLLRLLARS